MDKYQDLIRELAEDFNGILPRLTQPQIGAVLEHYPNALFDALADHPQTMQAILGSLGFPNTPDSSRCTLLGAAVLTGVREYVMPLVLKDVLRQSERNLEAATLEELGSHYPKAHEHTELALDLGVARTVEIDRVAHTGTLYLQPSKAFPRRMTLNFDSPPQLFVYLDYPGTHLGHIMANVSEVKLVEIDNSFDRNTPLHSLWLGYATLMLSESEFNTLKPEFERRGICVEVGK
jgi:hypothetical protein